MLKEDLLSNSETKKMQLNLVDLILSATIEIQESKNKIKILVSSRKIKTIGIKRENSNRKMNIIDQVRLKCQMTK